MKYRGFIKGSFLDVFAFRFEIWSWIVQDVLNVVVMIFLWLSIYQNQAPGASVSGFTCAQLIGYMVLVSLTQQWCGQTSTFHDVGKDIYDGNIAISLTKPISYRKRFYFASIGNMLSNLVLFFIPMMIVALVALQLIFADQGGLAAVFQGFAWYNIPLYFVCGICALSIMDSLDFIVAQVSFLSKSVFGLLIIKNTIFTFLAGGMIPFTFFPEGMQKVLGYLPFAGLSSNPVNMLLGRLSPTSPDILSNSFGVLMLSIVWAISLYLLSELVCAKMIRHVESAGG